MKRPMRMLGRRMTAQPMGWDGCGGGQIYYGSDSEAAGIVNMEEFGTYLGNGTYSFRR